MEHDPGAEVAYMKTWHGGEEGEGRRSRIGMGRGRSQTCAGPMDAEFTEAGALTDLRRAGGRGVHESGGVRARMARRDWGRGVCTGKGVGGRASRREWRGAGARMTAQRMSGRMGRGHPWAGISAGMTGARAW
jgi:hypothetical protein